ncbi:MAG TPA: DUF4861 domain-containing protein [Bacteroidetes bacterium]|nr:DUF4861 domain-containing protein [Bacteroidota bacterium]
MNIKHFLIIAAFLTTIGCQDNTPPPIKFTLTNDLDEERTDELITIEGPLFQKIMGYEDGRFSIYHDGNPVRFKMQDLDGDGKFDQLFLLQNFAKKESKEYEVGKKSQVIFKTPPRTNIHFSAKATPEKQLKTARRLSPADTIISFYYQMEGPAWENDKVAFRNYFDQRNGIDIFGKQVPQMVLHKVGIEGQDYHKLSDWGMDILKVGTSLGAGAIAMKKDGQVHRITGVNSTYKFVSGGDRSIFDLDFDGFAVGENKYNIKHRISIAAGKNYYHSEVSVDGLRGGESLVSGIVNLHSDTLYTVKESGYTILYTHAPQAENGAVLGMALIVPDAGFKGTSTAPKKGDGITSTYFVEMGLEQNKPTDFYFYTGWENQNRSFHERSFFEKSVRKAVRELAHPIIIK